MAEYGAETVQFFEIVQPFCALTYGSAPCIASLGVTGTRKCFNTRATCQDAAHYTPGGSPTSDLTLRFARPQEGLIQYGWVLPSLVSIDTTPASANLASMDPDIGKLGRRESISVTLHDHLHSDLVLDKYRTERNLAAGSPTLAAPYDPYTTGTFWGKWMSRNPYHANYTCRVREGYMGQALSEMRVREYVIERIEGPNDGTVRLIAKDLFSRVEARKAVAPAASRGELLAGITSGSTSFSLTPTGIGNLDYPLLAGSPSRLYVAIGDEIIQCTRVGDAFTVVQRGALNTVAAAHDAEDLVQWVLVYTAQRAHDIVYDLLTGYSGVSAAQIPFSEWQSQAAAITELYTARIATPTPVDELIGELSEQAGFTLWPDVETGLVRFTALRASSSVATIDDRAWIVDGSLALKRRDDKRVSQVWVYYGQINPVENLDERRNYRSRVVTVDPDAEADTQYGAASIKEIFSRWIPQFGRDFAESCGERIITLFRDPPVEAKFALHASRDGTLALTDFFTLTTAEIQDETGAELPVTLAAVEIERGENEIMIAAQQVQFAPTDTGAERVIYIENDSYNLNLRDIHDSLYAAPVGGSPTLFVRFIVEAGVVVGSTSTANAAMRTGTWPSGVTVTLQNTGRVQGMGGDGGGDNNSGAGQPGGAALSLDAALILDNSGGEIWGGGGGGEIGEGTINALGGGGGAGTDPGAGGVISGFPASNGAAGTATAGGAGAAGSIPGGNGGGPGLAGAATGLGFGGGAAGNAISKNGFTLTQGSPQGDVRGAVT